MSAESSSASPTMDYPPCKMGPSLEETMKKNPQLTHADLKYMKEWLSKQPHLPMMTEEELVPFLHCCHYSLERTKGLIDTFFTMRTHAPEMFSDRDPTLEVNRSQFDYFYVASPAKRDPNGYRVWCLGFQARDLSKFDANRSANMCGALVEVVVLGDDPTSPGDVSVLDARNLCIGHLAKASIHLLHVMLTFIQEAVPLRLKAVHVINIHAVVEKAMLLIKPFLSRELQRLLHFHSGAMESFYNVVPRDILPKDLGGHASSTTVEMHQELVDKLIENREWILSLSKRVVDESKRPGRAKDVRTVYGVEGSFKKLNID